jgi:hypothetical protein
MRLTVAKTKSKIVLLVILVAVGDLFLLMVASPEDRSRLRPEHPLPITLLYAALIGLGIAAQRWMENKPKYSILKKILYFLTLAWCLAFGLVLINLAMGRL